MRVLITGAGGQLGLDLLDAFSAHQVTGLRHGDLDVADGPALATAFEHLRPDVVVNAAAWTDVDGCESDPAKAHRINALGPWLLARACEVQDATLITISTDYVFDGVARKDAFGDPRAWTEFDAVDPINAYGRSKAAGEQLVRQTLDRHHIVRTAWLCGGRGDNFVRTMLRLAGERDEVRVVDDQHGSPTFTRDLAASILELASSDLYGTWNRTNDGHCTWYDLAHATFELAGVAVRLERQSSTALRRPAPRPAWSVLDDRHATGSGLAELPFWRDSLRHLIDELRELEGRVSGG